MWIHDISQSVLAAAVFALGLVIFLELRTLGRLRHTVDRDLGRVFEQLDLLRFDNQQLIEARAAETPPVAHQPRLMPIATDDRAELARISSLAAAGVAAKEIADRCGVPVGEARLLLALQNGQATRNRQGVANG